MDKQSKSFSDTVNERVASIKNRANDNAQFARTAELRTDEQNESLAGWLVTELNASEVKPYLAVAYSGIPRSSLERYLANAKEVGNVPAKLFMWQVKREPLWIAHKQRRETRAKGRENA